MPRWQEEVLSKHQHNGILYWESPTTSPLVFSPPPVPPVVHTRSGGVGGGWRCQRTGQPCSYPQGFTWKFHRTLSITVPALLHSRNQHLELGGVSHVVSGMKAAPVTTGNSWARSDCKIWMWNRWLKFAQPDHKVRAQTHSYEQIQWHSEWNYS